MEIVRKNRDGHRAQYEKAFEGYQQECIKLLEANLESLKNGKGHVVNFQEIAPYDHTRDYDRLIEMLGMSVDDAVELTNREFGQYVQDDWEWKSDWASSNSKYLSR